MRISFTNILSCTMIVAILLFSVSIYSFPSGKAAANGYEQTTEVVKGKLANELKKEAAEKIKSESLSQISLDELNLNKPGVYSISDNNLYFVQFKVKNSSEFEALSNVSVIFDKNKDIVSYQEMTLEMLDEETAKAVMYENGKSVVDEIAKKPDVTPQGFSVKKFSNCMSSSGISWGVAWGIGIFCSVACTAGGPAGCASCIIVETAWGGSIVSKCVAKAFGLL